jgi:hypothetical protein
VCSYVRLSSDPQYICRVRQFSLSCTTRNYNSSRESCLLRLVHEFINMFWSLFPNVPRLYECAVHCDNLLRHIRFSLSVYCVHDGFCTAAHSRQSLRCYCDATQRLVYPPTCVPALCLLVFAPDLSAGRYHIRALRNQLHLLRFHDLHTLYRRGK